MTSVTQGIHNLSWRSLVWTKGRWYLASSLFTKGLNLLLLPIYTRYLAPDEFGVLSTLLSMVQIFAIVISLYLDAAFARYFHEYREDHLRLRLLFSTVYWLVIGWGGLVLLLTLSTVHYWKDELVSVPTIYIILAFVPAPLNQIAQLGLVFLRQSFDAKRTTALDVLAAVITVIVTIPLLVIWHMGVQARLIGAMFPACFLFLYYTWYFRSRRLLTMTFDMRLARTCLFYSVPLIPNIASGWISSMGDRLLLAKYSDLNAVGLYSLAAAFATLLYLLQDAITQVTCAVTMSGLVKDRVATIKKLGELSLALWAVMLIADLGLSAFAREIVWLFTTNAYSDASALIGVYALVYVLAPQYRIFSDIVSYHNKTWVISTAAVMMAVVSVGLNITLVPIYGYIVAAYSFVAATATYTAWIFYWSHKYEPIRLHWIRMTLLLLVFATFYFCINLVQEFSAFHVIAKLALVLLFTGISYVIVKFKLRNDLA